MDKNINKNVRAILWIARILGTVLAVYLIFSNVIALITNFMAWDFIAYSSFAFIIIFAIGVILAWFKETIGGLILIGSAVTASMFCIYFLTGVDYDLILLLLFAVCFIIIGILFLIYRVKSRKLSAS